MSSKGSSEYRARQRERERRRRQQQERAAARQLAPLGRTTAEGGSSGARRAAATACGWCHEPITPRSRGPIPKWCSATCRHRAWEQARAAASGRSAVEIVERVVPVPVSGPRQLAWVDLLRELVGQVEKGSVYDRHLPTIAAAVDDVVRALHRRGRAAQRWPQG